MSWHAILICPLMGDVPLDPLVKEAPARLLCWKVPSSPSVTNKRFVVKYFTQWKYPLRYHTSTYYVCICIITDS